jgi:hypothetical protein
MKCKINIEYDDESPLDRIVVDFLRSDKPKVSVSTTPDESIPPPVVTSSIDGPSPEMLEEY